MKKLSSEIKQCRICEAHLPLGPRPVFSVSPQSSILVIGQAPGTKVHETGIPWNDPSGEELRRWLNVDREIFYSTNYFSIMPMGFCYPGKGKSGDLPPRPECAPKWHPALLEKMKNIKLTLLIGKYAHDYYLGAKSYESLTDNVKHFHEFLPGFFPLVHPSPRNKLWQKKNPWFKKEVVPELQNTVHLLLNRS